MRFISPAPRALFGLALTLQVAAAQAQVPVDRFNYSRSSSFTYRADGMLEKEVVEPDKPALCVETTHTYDAWGNKAGATTANCAAATGLALFDARTATTGHGAQTVTVAGVAGIGVPAGAFATSATVSPAAGVTHTESRTYDPRFGAVTSLTGPNNLTTSWTYDDFGRKTGELRADGTRSAMFHCLLSRFNLTAGDLATNTPGCPSPLANEIPADALRFEHAEPRNNAGAKIGAFSRTYFDRAGRKLRTVTEAFDGTAQPGGTARLIVQDTEYLPHGTASVTTQPYFLDSGSSTTTGNGDVGLTRTDVDVLGRPVAIYTADPLGSAATSVTFGSKGSRVAAVTTITYQGLDTTTTDDKGRTRKEEKNPDGKVVRVTDALGAQIVHHHDAFDNLIETRDGLQNVTTIAYDIRGRKLTLRDPDAGITAYCYDALGQLKAQQTSNQRGSHTYTDGTCPSASGTGTVAPTVANWTTLAYDRLGRQTERLEPEYRTTWTYDNCTAGKGKLCQTSTSHGVTRKQVYDSLGRPINTRLDVAGGPSFASALAYDGTTGRVASQTYPTGVKVNYTYTAKGYLNSVTLGTAVNIQPRPATPGGTPAASQARAVGSVLWMASAVNAQGKAESQAYGNGINSRAVFDGPTGRLMQLTAGPGTAASVADQRYTWNSVNLLTQRVDAIGDAVAGVQVSDTYQYDALGRLTQYQVAGNGTPAARTVTLQYNAAGMLLYKSDVGLYTYGPQGGGVGTQPHALRKTEGAINAVYGYDLNGNLVSASGGKYRTVAYTSFNLPTDNSLANGGIAGPGGSPRYTWVYDEDHKRLKEIRANAQGTRTTWNLHPDNQGGLGFEREEGPGANASNRHYISAGGMVVGVLVTGGALPTLGTATAPPVPAAAVTVVKLEYWHKDHLGSLIATTDHLGGVTARYAYDPFGKRRFVNSSYDAFGSLVVDWTTDTNAGTDRGYTGHEHLDDLGVIHMNGRIFDPTLGRFMQPDPFIQDPGNLQNFDRYAYCYNSPLVCTDPTGYFSLKKFLRMAVAVAVSWYLPGMIQNWMIVSAAGTPTAFVAMSGGGILTNAATAITTLGSVTSGAITGFSVGIISTGKLEGGLRAAATFGIASGIDGLLSSGLISSGGMSEVTARGVGGCLTRISSGQRCKDAFFGESFHSILALTADAMRSSMIESSSRFAGVCPADDGDCVNNISGESIGVDGDGRKIGGGRIDIERLKTEPGITLELQDNGSYLVRSTKSNISASQALAGALARQASPMGGVQGLSGGTFFGLRYGPRGAVDRIVEAFAGPHDWFNSHVWYDTNGNASNIQGASRYFASTLNYLNVLPAAPFAFAKLLPYGFSSAFKDASR